MVALLNDAANESPEAVAVVDASGSTSWSALNDRVNRLVNGLRASGLAEGDSLVVMIGNQVEFVECSLAAIHGGFLLVPVNWHWTADELAYVLTDAAASACIVGEQYRSVAAEAIAAVPEIASRLSVCLCIEDGGEIDGPFGGYQEFVEAADPTEPEGQVRGGPMFYTSGTTGRPKGVRSALSSIGGPPEVFTLIAHSMRSVLDLPQNDPVQGICGPLYHSAQWAFAFFALGCGASLVLQHRFDAAELLQLVDENAVTNLHLVPTQMVRLLDLNPRVREAFRGAHLHAVLHGAAPCAPSVKRAMIEWLGPVVTEYYGGTEGGFIAIIAAADWLDRPGSVGRPTEMMEIVAVGPDGDLCPPGVAGDLYFRNKMGSDFEYHNAPDKTVSAHRADGFGTLGDIGYFDADGYLFLSDRKIDMIVSGGVNIYPAEIEATLMEHPAVADVAVFGIPDFEMGERTLAAIQLREEWSWDESLESALVAHCRALIAGYKCPKEFLVLEELPRSEAGKLLKRTLREPYWADENRSI